METSVIRNKLHEYIDTADDRKIEAIYTILEEEINHHVYNEETLSMLYERREKHIKGESKSYTFEESIELIRKQKDK